MAVLSVDIRNSRAAWCLPGGDLVEARDDRARNPGHRHRVQDVLRLLAQVGAGDGDRGAAFQQASQRLDLRTSENRFVFPSNFLDLSDDLSATSNRLKQRSDVPSG